MERLTTPAERITSLVAFRWNLKLMLSGVGPSEKLQQFGIDVVADLPGVGQNEHVRINITNDKADATLSGFPACNWVFVVTLTAKTMATTGWSCQKGQWPPNYVTSISTINRALCPASAQARA
jgi:choline dehydrogenase-like flavoprotein